MKLKRWYIDDGDKRRTTMARTKKEAAELFDVSQYTLDKKGGILEADAAPTPPISLEPGTPLPATDTAWSGWIIANPNWVVRHSDGRPMTQVSAAVQAPSMAAVARILGVSRRHVKDFMSTTGNAEALAALAAHPPGTVLLQAMDPGGTVNGQHGWTIIPGSAGLIDDFDAEVRLEEWNGFKKGDPIKFDGQPRGKFEFRSYYKSAVQEYVEIYGGIGGKLKLRPVAPAQVHPIKKSRQPKTKNLEGLLP